jgi:homoserine dehydrogenase
MTASFRIGMIGCGTVGGGVLELLHRRADDLERLLGRRLQVTRIVVRDPGRPRHHLMSFLDPEVEWTADPGRVTGEPGVDLVVEVAGGTDTGRQWILDAIAHDRDVVTANKAALAFHGGEIFGAARLRGRRIFYEASVAAAIPIIEMLQNGLVANQITRISAILNGTCNYILTRMEQEQLNYETALEQAKAKGFAEADPTLDISGGDSAHKLALLAGIVTQSHVPVESVFTEGLERIAREDIEFARTFNYRIKMLAIARRTEQDAWDLRVHPTLIPRDEILAQVHNEFNAILVKGDAIGSMLAYGKGAGALPTASSIVADVVRAARGETFAMNSHGGKAAELLPMAKVELRNYIRMTVLDAPGVLGRITSFFGLRHISISSIHQPEAKMGHPVPVVLVTHVTPDRVVTDALRDLEQAKLLLKPPTRIRIDE